MKKLKALLLVLFLSFGVAACKPSDTTSATGSESTQSGENTSTPAVDTRVEVRQLAKKLAENVLSLEHVKLDVAGNMEMATNSRTSKSPLDLEVYLQKTATGLNIESVQNSSPESSSVDGDATYTSFGKTTSTTIVVDNMGYTNYISAYSSTAEETATLYDEEKLANGNNWDSGYVGSSFVVPTFAQIEGLLDQYLSIIDLKVEPETDGSFDINVAIDLKKEFESLLTAMSTPVYELVLNLMYEEGKTIADLTTDLNKIFSDESTVADLITLVDSFLPENYTVQRVIDYIALVAEITPDALVTMGVIPEEAKQLTVYESVMAAYGTMKVVDLYRMATQQQDASLAALGAQYLPMILQPVEGHYLTLADIYDNMVTPMIAASIVGPMPTIPDGSTQEDIDGLQSAYDGQLATVEGWFKLANIPNIFQIASGNISFVLETNENLLPTKVEFGFGADVTINNPGDPAESTRQSMSFSIAIDFDYVTTKTIAVPQGNIAPSLMAKDSYTVEDLDESGNLVVPMYYGTYPDTVIETLSVDVVGYTPEGNEVSIRMITTILEDYIYVDANNNIVITALSLAATTTDFEVDHLDITVYYNFAGSTYGSSFVYFQA